MTARRYAQGTEVARSKTVQDIERALTRFGASEFCYATRGDRAVVMFRVAADRTASGEAVPVRMGIDLPDREEFRETSTGLERTDRQVEELRDKEIRRRWRSLYAVVKALLVAVDDRLLTFEEAFLSAIVWGDNDTTADHLLPYMHEVLTHGGPGPRLLPEPDAETHQGEEVDR